MFSSRAPRTDVSERPFLIVHERRSLTSDGHFTPTATLSITPGLRTSGLLAALPGEEVKSLLFLLTFLTPNGQIQPSLPELSEAMQVSESKARDRMLRLQTFLWQGEPLVRARQRELGLDVYSPTERLLAQEQAPEEPPPNIAPAYRAANREDVIAHSRAAYTRPRAEVERMIAEQMGHTAEEDADTPEGRARRRLRALGVPSEQIELLVQNHPLSVIEEQLDWLPHRHAKTPARLIVAAIEQRYEPPARVRLERAIAQEEQADAAMVPEGEEVTLAVPAVPEVKSSLLNEQHEHGTE